MSCSSDYYYKCSWNNKWKNNNNYTTVALNTVYFIPKRVLVDVLMEIMHCLQNLQISY